MLGKSRSTSNPKFENVNTLIGEGTVLKGGLLKASGTVRIDGKYSGEIIVEGDCVIGEKGKIEGNIQAHHALIAGAMNGNVTCKESIHLTNTANMIGDITCNTFVVDEGAKIEGKCHTTQSTPSQQKADTNHDTEKYNTSNTQK